MTSTETPLAEAKPDSIEELFRRDPLKMTDADVDAVILAMREKRATWAKAEAEGKTRGRKPAAPKGPELDLSDLDD